MRNFGGTILLSATDLMRFMGCAHATSLDLARLRGEGPQPREDSEDAVLLQKHGDAHEAAHLAQLRAAGKQVVEIERDELVRDAEATRTALAEGAEIIFQGALLSGSWGGWSDFLERVERPSALGAFSYEVVDTKLKRSVHPKHVLQLVLYSDLLAQVQGYQPEFAHVELGSGERATLRLTDFEHYARAARGRLESFLADPQPTRPVPCTDCSLCRWADHCESVWTAQDSLFKVANITRSQVKKLEAGGIITMAALAAVSAPIRGIAGETLDKLVSQSKLQHARKAGEPAYMLRERQPGKGFELLPEPQPGDVFYDIEGDPYFTGGLEYLHGVWFDSGFRSFWAHDHSAEMKALADLLEFFKARIAAFPHAHIYHYAPYEITALRRLTAKYGVGEAFLDRLLRERRFVDLYAVVRGGLVCSEPNYSIKSLEVFYGLKREGEVKTAGGSVVAYERWRETGEQQILDEIEAYNRIDCISTQQLRDWLVSLRSEEPWPQRGEDAGEKEIQEDAEAAALRVRFAASKLPADRQAMLFDLGLFHRREAKPAWWAIFDSLGKDDDELIDDLDALGGLVATGPAEPVKRSVQRTYRFPPQETKLRAGKNATVPTSDGGFTTVSIADFNRTKRLITLKIGVARVDVLADRLSLHPDKPISADVIAAALQDVIEDQCGPRRYQAVDDLLARAKPRLTGDSPILQWDDLVAGTIATVQRMDATVLPIQGPPGTGKTYVTAHAILALVRKGKRIGVTSNSHEAIRNVLQTCASLNMDLDPSSKLDLVHKVSGEEDGYPDGSPVRRVTDNAEAAGGHQVVGGTVYFFARHENIQAFDVLFVDEAGQVGLANMAAMGRAARNIVLVGDPRQLPQVIQGAHPEPVALSCLDWMLGEHATVPADRGIFLGVTRRMHPLVTRFISEQVYEGRLKSHPETEGQAVTGTPFQAAGVYWVPVSHERNAQVAHEEVHAILRACDALLKGRWTDKTGYTRPICPADIIVVAPYNAQVNALRAALPEAIRVGTVDKFQGQEASVCLVSMTASSADETPRGLEFLLSRNRINVAISRTKALALCFGSQRLRETKCETVEQMRLVNMFCAMDVFSLITRPGGPKNP